MTELVLNYVATHRCTPRELIEALKFFFPTSYGSAAWTFRLWKMGLIVKDEQGILHVAGG